MRWFVLALLLMLIPGRFVQADGFFGNAGADALLENDDALDTWQFVSYSFWIKEPAFISGTPPYILAKYHDAGTNQGLIFLDTNNYVGGSASAFATPGAGYSLLSTVAVADGTWHHVAITHNKDVDARLYVDGVLDFTDSTVSLTDTPTDGYTLGRDFWWGGTAYFMSGSLADFRIYIRQLTDFEVADIANARGCDGIVEGLIWRLTMAEGSSGTMSAVKDISITGNHPTVGATPSWALSEVLDCIR